jgi:proteasome regulatory subunit
MNLASDIDFDELAEMTPDASGADIKAICTEAGMFAIRDDRTEVTLDDFLEAHEKLQQDDDGGADDSLAFA